MPKYRLTAPHIIGQTHLEAGTVVGDDTPYPVESPTLDMEPLDRSALHQLQKLFDALEDDAPGRSLYRRPEHVVEVPKEGPTEDEEEAQAEHHPRPRRHYR